MVKNYHWSNCDIGEHFDHWSTCWLLMNDKGTWSISAQSSPGCRPLVKINCWSKSTAGQIDRWSKSTAGQNRAPNPGHGARSHPARARPPSARGLPAAFSAAEPVRGGKAGGLVVVVVGGRGGWRLPCRWTRGPGGRGGGGFPGTADGGAGLLTGLTAAAMRPVPRPTPGGSRSRFPTVFDRDQKFDHRPV